MTFACQYYEVAIVVRVSCNSLTTILRELVTTLSIYCENDKLRIFEHVQNSGDWNTTSCDTREEKENHNGLISVLKSGNGMYRTPYQCTVLTNDGYAATCLTNIRCFHALKNFG